MQLYVTNDSVLMSVRWLCKLFLVLFLVGCHPCALNDSYHKQYSHLRVRKGTLKQETAFSPDCPYFVVLLVDAKHLDYSNPNALLSSVAKHPDGTRDRGVGHAWILLSGYRDGQKIVIEGGHSGELGLVCPRYLDRVFLATQESQKEPNPIRYLFSSLPDGYFEKGPGKHKPTYAIRIELSEAAFLKIYKLMQPDQYNYKDYSLTQNQCTTLVTKVAAIGGLLLDPELTMPIPASIDFKGKRIHLWQDPRYQSITLPTPDMLEKNMILAVVEGKVKPALRWYTHRE